MVRSVSACYSIFLGRTRSKCPNTSANSKEMSIKAARYALSSKLKYGWIWIIWPFSLFTYEKRRWFAIAMLVYRGVSLVPLLTGKLWENTGKSSRRMGLVYNIMFLTVQVGGDFTSQNLDLGWFWHWNFTHEYGIWLSHDNSVYLPCVTLTYIGKNVGKHTPIFGGCLIPWLSWGMKRRCNCKDLCSLCQLIWNFWCWRYLQDFLNNPIPRKSS